MLAYVYSASTFGVDAHLIQIETHFSDGMPKYSLVGLPDRAVKESYDRIRAAVKNTGARMAKGTVIVNLAPADLPKEGSAFDLPIAAGLLAVSGQLNADRLATTLITGELALDGKLRPVRGVLPMAVEARKRGLTSLVVPPENAAEAAVVEGMKVFALQSLDDVIRFFNIPEPQESYRIPENEGLNTVPDEWGVDFADVRGQENVKRAMEIAAAGGHNIIMVGPPGSGKTMLARRLPTILPPMTPDESLETTKIHSVAGFSSGQRGLITQRPFRAPHHTVSDVALVGGGSIPMPGEISLAHNGVLFLDELPEFKRNTLEVLRQPVEDGSVCISRARMSVIYPSRVMLVASMNPSPAGDWYDPSTAAAQSEIAMRRYLSRISGPLLDRIDIHIEVNKLSFDELSTKAPGETSAQIRERVIRAREFQQTRFLGIKGVHCNAQMNTKLVRKMCQLDAAGETILKNAITKYNLSARAFDRILKVARTIADMEQSDSIRTRHIAEAVQYRNLDREGWLG
jgi:magnesium chelatase family protein